MDGWGPGLCYHPIKVKSGHATAMVHQAHVWGINTPHLFSESIQSLGYCLLSFCFNSISPNLCVWERSPRSVHGTFGWPSKVIQRTVIWVWAASKGGRRLPNLCKIRASLLLLFFFVPLASCQLNLSGLSLIFYSSDIAEFGYSDAVRISFPSYCYI